MEMAKHSVKRLLCNSHFTQSLMKREESYRRLIYSFVNRFQSQRLKADKVDSESLKESNVAVHPHQASLRLRKDGIGSYSSGDEDLSENKEKRLELSWLPKALEPALQLCRWALTGPTGNGVGNKPPPSTRSVSEIIASIQRSKTGIQDWSLSDLTVGLFLIYLRQASVNPFEDVTGIQISSDRLVHDLIYHVELAKGCYKDNAAALARNCMLRESNVLKFVKYSSVMRPGYYIGIDTRRKLVILGIRGTHTVYDLITDVVSSSDGEVTLEGFSTHFGTAEAARWFLTHEMGNIRKCLEKYEGFKLRLVGHSLGGATAALLAIMLRKKSYKELGFSPEIVSAVGYAAPPCVSKELAESCSSYVRTVVMQDDIIPRLSVASLMRLRNEILQTDWMSVIEKEDWRSVIDLVTNAKQVVSSVQDVAAKLADYAKFRSNKDSPDDPMIKKAAAASRAPLNDKTVRDNAVGSPNAASRVPEELFVPGTVYYLKRNVDADTSDYFTLWKRNPGEHFQRIVLSSNLISDHKCDSHYYALRDVLKGLPSSNDEGNSLN
ncbi:putative lipoprotein lipase [Rosa chinensis]|uniref:Putative lipoprotein lipase n=1 Tax=Rosa chinensis TaxID=74649 RepID=A0A2P6PVF8_ROSCH|nr:uncharacterized protein LOC112169163 [Rosa chinensis]XP_040365752.1 uncharacterized protein LOC112169163 [Rosa chinensis]PRQ25910.1 putative lipoprotein lipase [Rosa chinensis]